jgi:predicted ATPase
MKRLSGYPIVEQSGRQSQLIFREEPDLSLYTALILHSTKMMKELVIVTVSIVWLM